MKQAILNGSRNGMILNLTGDRDVLDAIMVKAEDFLVNSLPVDLGHPAPPTPDFRSVDHPWIASAKKDMLQSNPVRDEGIVVSTQVAYVAEGGRLYDVEETVSASVSVVSHYLTTGKWQPWRLCTFILSKFMPHISSHVSLLSLHGQATCGMLFAQRTALMVHTHSFLAMMALLLSSLTVIPTRPKIL